MTFGICQRYDIVALAPWYILLSTAADYPSLLPVPDHDKESMVKLSDEDKALMLPYNDEAKTQNQIPHNILAASSQNQACPS